MLRQIKEMPDANWEAVAQVAAVGDHLVAFGTLRMLNPRRCCTAAFPEAVISQTCSNSVV